MKLLHSADWHLGKKIDGKYGLIKEQGRVLKEIVTIAQQEQPDAVILAGDIFDKLQPSVEAQSLFYKAIRILNNNGNTPIIVIAGNHDSPDLIEVCNPLAIQYGIFLLGWPNSKIPRGKLLSGIEILSNIDGLIELKLPKYTYPLRIMFTPYVNEARLKQRLDNNDAEIEDFKLADMLKEIWSQIAEAHLNTKGVNIMVAHHYFINNNENYIEDDEEKPIKIGTVEAISTSYLPKELQYVALGHLHSLIIMDKPPCPCPVVYSGSPLPYSFDDKNQKKHINIVEVEPSQKAKIRSLMLKTGKKLIRYRAKSIDDAKQWLAANQDCFVELTVITPKGIPTSDKKDLYELHANIISIIPELQYPDQTGEDGQPIDLTANINDLFIDYFKSKNKGESPSQDLIDIFSEIIEAKETS